MSEKRNNIWLAAHYILTMVASLVSLKFNLMNFGSETFGIWVLISSIWGLSNVVDLGFGLALIRAVSKERDNPITLSKVTSTGFVFFFLFGFVILAIGLLVGNLYYIENPSLINNQIKLTATNTNFLLGIFFYINYISTFFRSVYEGLGKFVFYSKIAMIYSLLTLLAAFFSWLFALDIAGLALLMLSAAAIQLFLLAVFSKSTSALTGFKPSNFNLTIFKELFSFSIGVQGATILGTAVDPVLKYIIGSGLNVSFVGYYDIAKRFSQASSGLFFAAFRTIYPKAARIEKEEEKTFLLNEVLSLSRKGILYGGLVFMAASPLFAAIFIYFYASPLSYNIFLLLTLVESVNLFGYSYYSMLMGTGEAKFLALVQLINLIGVAVFLFIGIKLTDSYMGIAGYSLTIILGNFLMLSWLKRSIDFSRFHYLMHAGGIKLIAQFAIICAAFISLFSFDLDPFITAFGLSAAWLLLFGSNIKNYSEILMNLLKQAKQG